MARLENDTRKRRTKEGLDIAKAIRAKELGIEASEVKFGGRKQKDREEIIKLLGKGLTVEQIAKAAGVGVATIYRVKKELKEK
jgi:DNA invertase Pin-like site-specific DNA recombinase